VDLLSDILSRMKLSGTFYFRTSFTSPWGLRVPAFEKVSRFHFVHRGRCLIRIDPTEEPVQLEKGDLIIITRGAAHTLYCDPTTETLALPLDEMIEKTGFTGSGTLVYGVASENSQETQLICGHFALDKNVSHPLIDALPSYIHIKNYGESAGEWMESTLKIIGIETSREEPGSYIIALKMSEIIFTQALRAYLLTEGVQQPILAGFAEPRISKALGAFHKDPTLSWSVDTLASTAGLSRTAFMSIFNKCMLMTPMTYITHWRMQIAQQMLLETNIPIIEIAENAGYQSEPAFGRVFKRHFDIPPATYRRQRDR